MKNTYKNNSSIEELSKHELKLLIKILYIINEKNNYILQHSYNVARYAVLIGNELKLKEYEISLLRIGGMLHDIGKICIPDNILNKSETLTNEEFEIIKKHSTIGEILIPDDYKEIKRIVRNHHERYDGSGYPDKLKEENIPFFARIISIADAFDAMTTQRVYNNIKTLDEAIDELYKSSKKQYNKYGDINQQLDRNLVNIFISGIKKDNNLMLEFEEKDKRILNKRKILKKP